MERIFVTLNATLESIESRIKAEQFRQRVMLCFRMFEDNAIYARDFLIKLQNIFLGLVKTMATVESDDEDLDGVPLSAAGNDDDEDLDGVPINLPTPSVKNQSISPAPKRSYSPPPSRNIELPDMSSKWNQVCFFDKHFLI